MLYRTNLSNISNFDNLYMTVEWQLRTNALQAQQRLQSIGNDIQLWC